MTNGSYDKKFQIFVSSTYKDLIEERQKIVEGILESRNIPAGMELFTASNNDQWHIIEKWIDESDIVILLIGSRYGSIPQGEEKSYTHKEYDYAKEKNKIVLPFIMSESHMYGKVSSGPYKSQDILENINQEKFDKFKKSLLNSSLCKVDIKNIDQLKTDVILSIQNETRDLAGGWIREKDIQSIGPVENETNLKRKNEKDYNLYKKLEPVIERLHEINLYLLENHNRYLVSNLNDLYRIIIDNSTNRNPGLEFLDDTLNQLFDKVYNSSANLYDLFIDNKRNFAIDKIASLSFDGQDFPQNHQQFSLENDLLNIYSEFKNSYREFKIYTDEKFYK
ncbi:DUF4062 domain-containing protein [Mammaliicoccus sciuri]|uniref:DUF4062 domain-containing protein n=1 Tax=Mammaliicoccus sciuri TaxID=1296 RepID=UPI0028FC37EB|nr:DUF4062 domain-containing protein [Mammaliicoccus sciuri]MDU0267908.1 DUF4062 domain-containing protein [Mammaliicoccus sciuri]